jgi:hypothetical protein
MRDLASTAWALGNLGSSPSRRLLGLLLQQALERSADMAAVDLTNLLWGIARLDFAVSSTAHISFSVRERCPHSCLSVCPSPARRTSAFRCVVLGACARGRLGVCLSVCLPWVVSSRDRGV